MRFALSAQKGAHWQSNVRKSFNSYRTVNRRLELRLVTALDWLPMDQDTLRDAVEARRVELKLEKAQ